jgi:hypothetical protein
VRRRRRGGSEGSNAIVVKEERVGVVGKIEFFAWLTFWFETAGNSTCKSTEDDDLVQFLVLQVAISA